MNTYLPAIGFYNIKKKSQLKELLEKVKEHPDQVRKIIQDEDTNLVLITKEVAPGTGIAICGEEDMSGNFMMEYYYPYLTSDGFSTDAECMLQRKSDKEAYDGICDDYRLGLNLIFSINNFMEYKKYQVLHGFPPNVTTVCLSALSVNGKILLPIMKDTGIAAKTARLRELERLRLLEDARDGDQSAIDSLTVDEMNLTTKVNRYLEKTDIYTLVESFIMPFGVECDQYTIMGEIKNIKKLKNSISNEILYQMDVECNRMMFRVLINHEQLVGEPKAGRRFKGDVWLQGTANYI